MAQLHLVSDHARHCRAHPAGIGVKVVDISFQSTNYLIHKDFSHSSEFLQKLQIDKPGLTPTSKMRLLNLNSYAQLCVSGYKGVLLPADSPAYQVPMAHTKSKQILVNGMLDALKSLLPASNQVQGSVDSKMGFLIGK